MLFLAPGSAGGAGEAYRFVDPEDPERTLRLAARDPASRLAVLAELDWDVIWDAATDTERRTLLDEFLVRLDVFPDHLEVDIRGAGKLNVALHEVGLRNRAVETTGVGGMSRTITPRGSQTTSGVSGVR